MILARMSSKGQVTIPLEVRKALGIAAGDDLMFFDLGNGEFSIRPRNGSIRDLKGIVPKLDYTPTLEQLDQGISEAIEEEYLASVGTDTAPKSGVDSKDEAA